MSGSRTPIIPLPSLARFLSLAICEKSAGKLAASICGVPDVPVVVVLLELDFDPPPQAATTKSAVLASPTIARPLHATRILPPSLALGRIADKDTPLNVLGSRPVCINRLQSADAGPARSRASRHHDSRQPGPPVVDLVAQRLPRLRAAAQDVLLSGDRSRDAATPLAPAGAGAFGVRSGKEPTRTQRPGPRCAP